MSDREFYSRGKLLISGEYLVLSGAKALAVPLNLGQKMVVTKGPVAGVLFWETYVKENIWFKAAYQMASLDIIDATDDNTARFVQKLLKAGTRFNPTIFKKTSGIHVRNDIEFDITWGLGSSSSLISNLAWWFGADLYKYYRELYKGSGYDVFCARSDKAMIYSLQDDKPVVHRIDFNPDFSGHLYFVYLGKKQDSQESVKQFRDQVTTYGELIREISAITDQMVNAITLEEFSELMRMHEKLISSVIKIDPVKERLFVDFPGEIKSLGAWGGDFILAASPLNYNEVKDYFSQKNFHVIFNWKDLVFHQ